MTLRVRPAHAADLDLLAGWAAAMAWETEHKRLDPATIRDGVMRLARVLERAVRV